MVANTSIISLFMNAGLVVQAVMVVLLLASIFSWTLIFQRAAFLMKCKHAMEDFELHYFSGIDLGSLYNKLSVRPQAELSALESIFVVGFKEFLRLSRQCNCTSTETMKGIERAIRAVLNKEIDKLEHNLSFLATIQSTSPFIGLFGTVWGIMHAFKDLGAVQQASIAMVAPGISEALVATAMGLVAAIPAGIAYNRYVYKVDRLVNSYNIFIDDFINTMFREAAAATSSYSYDNEKYSNEQVE